MRARSRRRAPRAGRRSIRTQTSRRRRLRERGKDPAAVEPARTVPTEDAIPVDVARPECRRGGASPVGTTESGANAEAALDEVETVPHGEADPVVGKPAHVRRVDA